MGRQRKAYVRKLCIAQMIHSARHDLRSLEALSGMPRRTIQDCIADLPDIGIDCHFVQDGPKHRHGYYAIRSWGDHDPLWVKANLPLLLEVLADTSH